MYLGNDIFLQNRLENRKTRALKNYNSDNERPTEHVYLR